MHDVGEAKKSMSHRLMIAPIGTESDSSVAKRAARRAVRDPSVYGHALLDRLRVDGPRARARVRAGRRRLQGLALRVDGEHLDAAARARKRGLRPVGE